VVKEHPSGAKAHTLLGPFSARLKSCPDTRVSSQASRDQMFTKADPFFVLILCYGRSQGVCFTREKFGRPKLLHWR
jgi:hypothetical protein